LAHRFGGSILQSIALDNEVAHHGRTDGTEKLLSLLPGNKKSEEGPSPTIPFKDITPMTQECFTKAYLLKVLPPPKKCHP
jgi:hypothetical protein